MGRKSLLITNGGLGGNSNVAHGTSWGDSPAESEKQRVFPQRSASPPESINSGDSRRIFIILPQERWREHVQTVGTLLLMPVV